MTRSRDSRWQPLSLASRLAALGLLLVHAALVLHGASRHSAVHDEVVYPTVGYAHLTEGDYRMNAEHPPFLRLLTGATWLGTGIAAREVPGFAEANAWRFGIAMIYGETRPHRSLLMRARVPVALLSVFLCLAVFLVGCRLGGPAAGLAALALYAFDPLVIAHAGFATTDLGAAALYFAAAVSFPWAVSRGGSWRIALSGLALGLALASKFSTIPLVGILAAVPFLVVDRGAAPGASRPASWLRVGWIGAIALATVAATYGPAGPSLYLDGLSRLKHHAEVGHPAYAFGRYGSDGFWWFFPAAWAVKTPVPVLLASFCGVIAVGGAIRRERALASVLLLGPAFVLGPSLVSSLNLGVRHLLPAVPFLAVAGGMALGWGFGRGKAARAVVLVALAWLAVGTFRVHPDEMAFANEIAGGPDRLFRVLSDSNVDWGQDLPALAREVSRSPLRRLYLAYFGTADPGAFGLRYCWIPSFGMVEARAEEGPDPGGREWIAISVTNLMDVYTRNHNAHAWLRERPMTAFPGRSIALFDITGDAEAHARLGETALAFGEYGAARRALGRAAELAPREAGVRVSLATALAGEGRWAEVAAECRLARSLAPRGSFRADICGKVLERSDPAGLFSRAPGTADSKAGEER